LISVWGIEAQKLLWTPISVGQTISRFSPNGRELFVNSGLGVLEVRDALTGQLTHSFNFGDNHLSKWQVSPDGNGVAIALLGGGDNAGRKIIENWKRTAGTWELAFGYRIQNDIEGYTWSPDSALLVDLPRGVAHASREWWDEQWRICDRDLSLSCAEFSRGGDKILTGSQTGKVRLWQTPVHRASVEAKLLAGKTVDVFASSRNMRRILASSARSSASANGSVFWLLDGDNRHVLAGPTSMPGEITGCQFSPDSTKVAAAIRENLQASAVILDGNTGKPIGSKVTLSQSRGKEPTISSNAIAWSGDCSKVAVTTPEQVIAFDVATQQVRQYARDAGGVFLSSEFSPDGKHLFIFREDGVIKWSLDANNKKQRLITAPTAFGCLSPDGNILALSAPSAGSFQLWNASDGAAIGLPVHSGAGSASLEFNSVGDRLLATTDDAFRVWTVATAAPLTENIKKRLLHSAHFVGNGELIITTSNSGTDFWSDDGRHLAGPVDTGFHVDVVDAGNTLLSRNGDFLVTRSMPGRYCDAPEWLADFAEAMCGSRVSAGGVLESLEDTQPQLLEASFSRIRSSSVGGKLKDWALQMTPPVRP
jgi:WD40 repeat protein